MCVTLLVFPNVRSKTLDHKTENGPLLATLLALQPFSPFKVFVHRRLLAKIVPRILLQTSISMTNQEIYLGEYASENTEEYKSEGKLLHGFS